MSRHCRFALGLALVALTTIAGAAGAITLEDPGSRTSRSAPPDRPLEPCLVAAVRALPAQSSVRLWRIGEPSLRGVLQPLAAEDSLMRVRIAPEERPPFTSVPLRTVCAVDVIERGHANPLLVVLGIAAGGVAGMLIAVSVEADDGSTDPRIFGPLLAGPIAGGLLAGHASRRIPVATRLACDRARSAP